jgi:cytochrome c peroxidase
VKSAFVIALVVILSEGWVPSPPLGLDLQVNAPLTNLPTPEKAALGRNLFFDRHLSRDGTMSCASCHDPKLAFSDGRIVARGIGGAQGRRNVPSLINRAYGETFFWDGRTQTLEDLALQPIFNRRELGITKKELEHRTGMGATEIAAALATYLRTIRSGDSPFDRYVAGDTKSLSTFERQGLELFRGKAGCTSCHAGSNFSDEHFHNTGVAWRDNKIADEGRFAVSGMESDRGAFKTPTLRDVSLTAPYMHDGSFATLEDVVQFYSDGGRNNPHLDPKIFPRRFTNEEKRALIAFLQSLTGRLREGV